MAAVERADRVELERNVRVEAVFPILVVAGDQQRLRVVVEVVEL
jgi:hypothetical protein